MITDNWRIVSSGGAGEFPLERDHLQRPQGQPSLQIFRLLSQSQSLTAGHL